MNKEVKEAWVEKLRSGEYSQAKGLLLDREGNYCCLGVLCDIHEKEGKGKWIQRYYHYYSSEGCIEGSALPPSVRHWVGISHSQAYHLAKLNDDGVSFTKIADIIESMGDD